MISTCVLHSEPHTDRAQRSKMEAFEVWTLMSEQMGKSCDACGPILADIENFASLFTRQMGVDETFRARQYMSYAPLRYEFRAFAVAAWENLEFEPYRTSPNATKSRYESERAENAINENAYRDFVSSNSDNPEFKGKFVAFVHGKLQGSDRSQMDLIYRMYDKFGNVYMYVGRSSGVEYVETVTPKVLRQE